MSPQQSPSEVAQQAILESYCKQAYAGMQLMYAYWLLLSADDREHFQAWLAGEFESLAASADNLADLVGKGVSQ